MAGQVTCVTTGTLIPRIGTKVMKKIYFATHNAHKLQEVQQILGSDYRVVSAAEGGLTEAPDETADTLAGNALIKARALYRAVHCPCFADDTGLLVEALGGAPGVHSARYAGPAATDAQNRAKLLQQLAPLAPPYRAKFQTVVAYISAQGEEHLFTGEVTGVISPQEVGAGGFGYDSLFVPDGYDRTFAQMPPQEKNLISHRYRAVCRLLEFLSHEPKA